MKSLGPRGAVAGQSKNGHEGRSGRHDLPQPELNRTGRDAELKILPQGGFAFYVAPGFSLAGQGVLMREGKAG
jgi:hypothetical protein